MLLLSSTGWDITRVCFGSGGTGYFNSSSLISSSRASVLYIAGEIMGGKHYRLQKHNLEREVLLRKNEQYVSMGQSTEIKKLINK